MSKTIKLCNEGYTYMNFYKAVLFDFDGTIIDSKEGVSKSVIHALNKFNIPVGDESKLDFFMGPPLHVSFQEIYGIEGELCDKAVAAFTEKYAEKGIYQMKLYDGIIELIKELRNKGIKVAVASAKPTVYVKEILDYLKIEHLFDAVVGNELNTNNPDKSSLINKAVEELGVTDKKYCAMVGDRHYDINGAVKAEVIPIGVAYGFGSEKELKDAGAEFLAHDTTELLNILLK